MTLGEYQMTQNVSLKKMDIQMGSFNNMILVDDWMVIQYDIITTNPATGEAKKGTTMEFARFGDYGELGAKVDEGWGGSRNDSYTGLLSFLTDEEKAAQNAFMQEIIDTQLPETDDLEAKYPVVYPTTIDTELGQKMKKPFCRILRPGMRNMMPGASGRIPSIPPMICAVRCMM